MDIINRHSKMPLHEQVYDILKNLIVKKEWEVGTTIPAELDLMKKFGVSRIVIRQVLNRLVNEGLIYRQQGRGTFVAEITLEQGLTRIISFTEDMHTRGLIPGTIVLFSGLMKVTGEIAEKLQISHDDEIVRLERLRLANNEPMSIEESYLVHRYCPDLLSGNFATSSLRQNLEQRYGIRIVRANQIIRAVAATSNQAKLLSVPQQSPLLLIERTSYSQQNVPMEYLRIYYHGGRYSLFNDLRD